VKHAKGGARVGAGRPLGSKDRLPRKGSRSEANRFTALEAELGKAYKERDDLKRQVDDLRFQLNYGKAFNGDSKALLTATYKAEYYPSQEQLYAAKVLLDREYPPARPGQYETDEAGKVVLYLPHNGRDPLPGETEAEKEKREAEFDEWLESMALSTAREVARRLTGKALSKAGGSPAIVVNAVSKVMAELEAEAAEKEQKTNGATAKPEPKPQPLIAPPAKTETPEVRIDPKPAPRSNGKAADVVLFCKPFEWFRLQSGREYVGGKHGYGADEVGVPADRPVDISELITKGCRLQR
jgi:hypothetical protein